MIVFSCIGEKESVWFFSPFLVIYVSVLWIWDEKNIIPVNWWYSVYRVCGNNYMKRRDMASFVWKRRMLIWFSYEYSAISLFQFSDQDTQFSLLGSSSSIPHTVWECIRMFLCLSLWEVLREILDPYWVVSVVSWWHIVWWWLLDEIDTSE